MLKDITVIIPSLNPDDKLLRVVRGLLDTGFTDILLVNDGSDAAHAAPFAEAAALPGITVLHHEVNRGKGRALKTAFAWVLEQRPSCRGVVTVDGDGQHAVADIRELACALQADNSRVYLGVRDFDDPQVPARSRFGNKTTSLVFRLLCGLHIQDTQTGLRGIPRQYLPSFLQVAGERFEYETNMLLAFREQDIPFAQIAIETVYINENETSHFRPVRDSVRIYRLILSHFLRFAGSGLLSFLVDILLFWAFGRFVFEGLGDESRILGATVLARVLSSLLNFAVNRTAVFHSSRPLLSTLWRYYTLCAVQMLASAGLVTCLYWLLPLPDTLIKCVVDGLLFLISFRIQQRFVFGKGK